MKAGDLIGFFYRRHVAPMLEDEFQDVETALAPDEVMTRVNATVEPETLFPGWPTKGHLALTGKMTECGFEARARRVGRNSFARICTATVETAGTGARICARLGIHPFVRSFAALWFGLASLFACVLFPCGLIALLSGTGIGALLLIVTPPMMLPMGLFVFWMGRSMSKADEELLRRWLQDVGDATLTSDDLVRRYTL